MKFVLKICIFMFERTSCQKIALRIISYQVKPSWIFHCYLNSMTWKGELSTYSTRASRIFFELCNQMQTKQRKINTDIVIIILLLPGERCIITRLLRRKMSERDVKVDMFGIQRILLLCKAYYRQFKKEHILTNLRR